MKFGKFAALKIVAAVIGGAGHLLLAVGLLSVMYFYNVLQDRRGGIDWQQGIIMICVVTASVLCWLFILAFSELILVILEIESNTFRTAVAAENSSRSKPYDPNAPLPPE